MRLADSMHEIELFFLYALAFSLPILEAPKNIAVVFFAVFWLAGRALKGQLHLRAPDKWEWALFAVLAVSTASTAYNWNGGTFSDETAGLRGTLSWTGIFWLIYKGDYAGAIKTRILNFAMLGAAVGLVWGTWQVYTQARPYLEFNSAGAVTQSVIYLGIVLIAVAGRLFAREPFKSGWTPAYYWACLVFFSAGLVLMGSRGGLLAVAAAAAIVMLAAIIKPPNAKARLAIISAVIVVSGISAYFAAPAMFQHERMFGKVAHFFSDACKNNADCLEYRQGDQQRVDAWRIGIAQGLQGEHPLLGIGPRKFDRIQVEKIHFDPPLDVYPFRLTHAHNLFLTKWAEEGALGLIAFLLLLGMFVYALATRIEVHEWAWTAAVGALVVPIASGFFNTTWKQEHAVLAMMLLAIHLSSSYSRQSELPDA
jgi:O-antigen ligase